MITTSELVATIQHDRQRAAAHARLEHSARQQAAVEACRGRRRPATIQHRVAFRLGYVPAGC